MTFPAILLGIFCAAISVWILCAIFHDLGIHDGWKQGYTEGRKAADDWWIGVESEAEQERVKLWQEGKSR